jgi:hypothetical protein
MLYNDELAAGSVNQVYCTEVYLRDPGKIMLMLILHFEGVLI